MIFGGHLGRHLEFLKTLVGAKPAPDEILKSNVSPLRKYQNSYFPLPCHVRLKYIIYLPDYCKLNKLQTRLYILMSNEAVHYSSRCQAGLKYMVIRGMPGLMHLRMCVQLIKKMKNFKRPKTHKNCCLTVVRH